MDRADNPKKKTWDEFEQEVQNELEQSRRALNEVNLMLEQSQAELSKLTQRNTVVTSHLQMVQSQFDSMPRTDIRTAYASSLEVQQRLLVMRGQLEKLQSDQTNLKRFVDSLEKIQAYLSDSQFVSKSGRAGGGSAVVEMVINAQEAVRQRLSQQMHDGPAQALSNFILQTDIATRMFDVDPEKSKDELLNLRTAAMSTFQKVRGFITELRPMMLDDLGLFPTLRRYIDATKEQTGNEINLTIKGQERRLESYLEVMIFRAVQELVVNATRHNLDNPSRLQINVFAALEDNQIKITVTDNGKGCDPQNLTQSNGLGLKLIRERVDMLGGFMDVDSSVGQGCKISFQVPALEAGAVHI